MASSSIALPLNQKWSRKTAAYGSCVSALLLSLIVSLPASAAGDKSTILAYLEQDSSKYTAIANALWDKAELGYQEHESSALLQESLEQEGFFIEAPVAGIPTAFVASFGQGKPVIALLAEFDALPGISQSHAPVREKLTEKNAGQACGHHLFGAGSVGAAVAVKRWMAATTIPGTVRLYGTPAEEGGSGKVYMVREGLFDDVDVVLHWHPADKNTADIETTLANKSARVRFHGVSAHAAGAPEKGRSALDGVEAMNFMVNQLREHVPQESRIHYVITNGGAAPNVVPDFAEVYYYVRHPLAKTLHTIWDRVIFAAEGAAKGTGTRMEYEVMHGNHSILPNETLTRIVHANLSRVGGVSYNKKEQAYAEKIRLTLTDADKLRGSQNRIKPMATHQIMGSTDVGDVSWTVPTVGLRSATWVPGTSAHSWQAIAAGGMSIGHKGMMVAAKTLALTAADLLLDPNLINAARREFEQRLGPDFHYQALLGNRSPPLDYRSKTTSN